MDWLTALAAIFGLGTNCLLQIGWFRLRRTNAWMRSILVGFAAGAVVTAAASLRSLGHLRAEPLETTARLAANWLAYLALSYGYFHFLNLGETSLRVRLLREIRASDAGLAAGELLRRYGTEERVRRRTQRLLENRQIVRRDGRYFIGKPTVLLLANSLEVMKRLLLKKRG